MLSKKTCKPCEGETKPLPSETVQQLIEELNGWKIDDSAKSISKSYKVKNFVDGVHFIEKIAEIAEQENHHPDVHLTGYKNVKIDLSTHSIGGLSENDFIVAAKIEELNYVKHV